MPLQCPACPRPGLEVGSDIELPADEESDEIALEILRCGDCGLIALGLAEESHRGSSDDCWRHGGWTSDGAEVARVEGLIADCPQPSQRLCGCESHQALIGFKDELRRREGRFPVRFVSRTGEVD